MMRANVKVIAAFEECISVGGTCVPWLTCEVVCVRGRRAKGPKEAPGQARVWTGLDPCSPFSVTDLRPLNHSISAP